MKTDFDKLLLSGSPDATTAATGAGAAIGGIGRETASVDSSPASSFLQAATTRTGILNKLTEARPPRIEASFVPRNHLEIDWMENPPINSVERGTPLTGEEDPTLSTEHRTRLPGHINLNPFDL